LEDNPEQKARDLCAQIGVDPKSTQQIVKKSQELILTNTDLKSKEYSRWDYIPYSVMVRECERYREASDILKLFCGVRCVFVDAENSIDQVVGSIAGDINSQIFLENI
jgi:hypothetical protein